MSIVKISNSLILCVCMLNRISQVVFILMNVRIPLFRNCNNFFAVIFKMQSKWEKYINFDQPLLIYCLYKTVLIKRFLLISGFD